MLTDEEIAKLRLEALKASEPAADAIDDGVNENEFLTRFKENLRHLPEMLKNEEIASLMLSNGFTIKPGMSDLKDYVYTAARAIESAATAPLLARIAELTRELEEARKDAERYLFAADPQSDGYAVCEWNDGDWIPINTEDLDAAIKEQT